MPRYIYEEAILQELKNKPFINYTDIINRQPTADVVEVVRASWGEDGYCTNCGWYVPYDCEGNAFESPYCLACGAKMDGRREK